MIFLFAIYFILFLFNISESNRVVGNRLPFPRYCNNFHFVSIYLIKIGNLFGFVMSYASLIYISLKEMCPPICLE